MSPILFSDRGCPFAHRVLALLVHLGLPFDRREVPYGQKPRGLEAYSPTGQIPVWVDGDLVLTESRVILESVAEQAGWSGAWPADLRARARARHAMALVDAHLMAGLGRDPAPAARPRLEEAIARLGRTVAPLSPVPSVLGFHLGPSWHFLRSMPGTSFAERAVGTHPGLARWLDAAAALPAVRRSAADPELVQQDLAAATR